MELASCLKTITELWSTSSRKDDDKSQGQSKPQRHVLAGGWRAETRWNWGKQDDRGHVQSAEWQELHIEAEDSTVPQSWCSGKVPPKGLLSTSYLACVSPYPHGNPAVQHVSNMPPPKPEPSHLRKQFILGSGNAALANVSQSSCYYHFTAYRQSAIWPYISAAFDGSPGRRSDTTAITVAGVTHTQGCRANSLPRGMADLSTGHTPVAPKAASCRIAAIPSACP